MTVPGFETTCPECGNVFDVDADATRVPCPRCSVVLEFDEEDAAPPAPAAPAPLAASLAASPVVVPNAERRRHAQEQAAVDREQQRAREERERQREAEERARQQAQERERREAERTRLREERQHVEAERQARLEAERREREKDHEARRAEKQREKEARAGARAKLLEEKRAEREAKQRAKNDEKLRRHAEKKAKQAGQAALSEAAPSTASAEPDKSARQRFLGRDRVPAGAVPVVELEGVGPAYERKLADAGVRTTQDLLGADERALAEATGIPRKTLRRWQDMAELMAVPGVGKQYAEVLVRCDVHTVADLARRDATALHALIQADHERVGVTITRARLSPKVVQKWIDAAAAIRPPAPSEGEVALRSVQDAPRRTAEPSGPARAVAVVKPGKARAGPEAPDAPDADKVRRAKQEAAEKRMAEREAERRAKSDEAAAKQAQQEEARKAKAEAAAKRRAEAEAARKAKAAEAEKKRVEKEAQRAEKLPPLERIACPHCEHAFNTRAGRRKVTCPKCHSRLLLLAPDEADPTEAKRQKQAAREAARKAKAEAVARRRAEKEAEQAETVEAKPAKTRPAKEPAPAKDKPDAEAAKAQKAAEARARAEQKQRDKAEKEAAKQRARQEKEDQRAAEALAKDLSIDPALALQMVKAGIRSLEDLAGQDAQALYEKLQGGGA